MVSTNLSQSGMFVDLADVPPIGSELVCNLATSGGQSAIQIRGRITWHNGASGVGIEFVDLSDEQAEELNGLVGDGVEIPLGEQSAAVYELMELESADTSKTIVDNALSAAVDAQIDEGMDDMAEMPSLDEAILLPQEAPEVPLPQYDSLDEPAFTMGSEVVRAELPQEDTDQIAVPSREPRRWLLAAVAGTVGAVAIGMAGFGLFGSEGEASDASATAEEARDGKRQRVLALVGDDTTGSAQTPDEAIERIRAAALDESNAEHGSQPMAVGGPMFDAPKPTSIDNVPKVAAPVIAAPKKPAKPVAKQVKRQVLGGVVVRESSGSLILRLPFTGTAEKVSHYVMNEPTALAVNLPYAQPKKGFFQSLEPKSDAVRLLWVRERLGGVHFRVFFKGERPTCDVQTDKQELVLRCKY